MKSAKLAGYFTTINFKLKNCNRLTNRHKYSKLALLHSATAAACSTDSAPAPVGRPSLCLSTTAPPVPHHHHLLHHYNNNNRKTTKQLIKNNNNTNTSQRSTCLVNARLQHTKFRLQPFPIFPSRASNIRRIQQTEGTIREQGIHLNREQQQLILPQKPWEKGTPC